MACEPTKYFLKGEFTIPKGGVELGCKGKRYWVRGHKVSSKHTLARSDNLIDLLHFVRDQGWDVASVNKFLGKEADAMIMPWVRQSPGRYFRAPLCGAPLLWVTRLSHDKWECELGTGATREAAMKACDLHLRNNGWTLFDETKPSKPATPGKETFYTEGHRVVFRGKKCIIYERDEDGKNVALHATGDHDDPKDAKEEAVFWIEKRYSRASHLADRRLD
jgi:hypothetical protein